MAECRRQLGSFQSAIHKFLAAGKQGAQVKMIF
jgi:hypothetical protein